MKKRIMSVLLAVCLVMSLLPIFTTPAMAVACDLETFGYWTVGVEDYAPGEYLITGYSGTASNVTVPTQLGQYKIVGIESLAFWGNTTMKVLNVPDGLVVYGLGGCQVETVNLGADVVLASGTFASCSKLKKVNLPETTTSITGSLFKNCSSLETISIPSSVTSIESSAFEGCASLKSISLPEGVTEIGICAFKGCTSLSSIVLPKTLEDIASGAFLDCTALTSVVIPENVKDIGTDAFNYCDNLTSIKVAEGNDVYFNNEDGSVAYYHNTHEKTYLTWIPPVENYTVPANIDIVDMDAARSNKKIKKVTIHENVEWINQYAFRDCINLSEIKLEGHSNLSYHIFENVTATIYYPRDLGEYDESIRNECAGNMTWVEYCSGKHLDNEGKVLREATCSETGVMEHVCTICNKTYTRDIPKAEHAFDEGVVTKEVTCTSHGAKLCTCTVCGYSESQVIYSSGCGDSFDKVKKEPTCTESGTSEEICGRCGRVMDEDYIPPLGHDYTDAETEYHADKKSHGVTCIRCGEIAYKPCTFGDAVVTTEASLNNMGVKTYTCTVCDGSYTEEFVYRIYGKNRYQTAFSTANALKEQLDVEKFDNVVIASGLQFADALAGSYLAAVKNAPILLVNSGSVAEVAEYVKANLADGGTVYLLGGTAAVPAEMETALNGLTVKRLSGKNRFGTNLAILEEAGTGDEEILVCTGWGFADSLSASAVGKPILLVNTELTEEQKEFLETSSGEFVIIGGTGAVNAQVQGQLMEYGSVARLSGKTRYETSVLVAERFFDGPDVVLLAYGQNFPDGLCGGPLAYELGAPLILCANNNSAAADTYVQENAIAKGAVLGGASLISDVTAMAVFTIE